MVDDGRHGRNVVMVHIAETRILRFAKGCENDGNALIQ